MIVFLHFRNALFYILLYICIDLVLHVTFILLYLQKFYCFVLLKRNLMQQYVGGHSCLFLHCLIHTESAYWFWSHIDIKIPKHSWQYTAWLILVKVGWNSKINLKSNRLNSERRNNLQCTWHFNLSQLRCYADW